MRTREPGEHEVVVVGGGQAGSAVGYHLRRAGVDFTIVGAGAQLGHVWRDRWDSLRLFTPAQYAGLPGMPFPAAPDTYPHKDDVSEYLVAYAERFALPVRLGARVTELVRTERATSAGHNPPRRRHPDGALPTPPRCQEPRQSPTQTTPDDPAAATHACPPAAASVDHAAPDDTT
jgi:monoamine oxidase